ncbi:hypothetical protein C8Q75DRAFT_810935 [Abortiporus biennis]|nr:hypothetical protein C8Q75DRAFT_810935 [Abortiporus biennis]
MRFALPLVALFGTLAHVSGRALTERTSLTERALVDICAEVDAALSVDVLGIAVAVGLLDVCLCISALPLFIETNAVAIAAVNLVGVASVTAEITALINSASGHKSCSYPDHADPICSAADVCGFQCKDGFELSPDKKTCICSGIVCNGKCIIGKACPSSVAKRDIETIQKRSASCSDGFTACGVYGWTGLRSNTAWECVDTTNDLESCGGCTIPLGPSIPRGIDCTAIPGVSDVSCKQGSCHVSSCLPGYAISFDGSYCIRKQLQDHFAEDFKGAVAWGLEHVPLK